MFALGVLLYFFSTGVRPFGESQTMSGMRRLVGRDGAAPRQLRPDYPPWLPEIVLRCLEVEPAWRYPTAAQLAFELSQPDQVKLTARSERLKRDPRTTVLRRRFNKDLTRSIARARDSGADCCRPDCRGRGRPDGRVDATQRCALRASVQLAFWRPSPAHGLRA